MAIQVNATGGIERISAAGLDGLIPPSLLRDLVQFLLDKRSGNIILNVQLGVILGGEFQQKKSYR